MTPADRCYQNIILRLRALKLPELECVDRRSDRCFFKDTNIPLNVKFDSAKYWKACLQLRGFSEVIGHGSTAISSYREPVSRYSMQFIFHSDGRIEIDFDPFNPDMGLGPALGHAIQWMWWGATDPEKVYRYLVKNGRIEG
jgi:hypothetical protein